MEILLLAPGLFSTTTGWPSRSANHGAMIRDTISAPRRAETRRPSATAAMDRLARGREATWRQARRRRPRDVEIDGEKDAWRSLSLPSASAALLFSYFTSLAPVMASRFL